MAAEHGLRPGGYEHAVHGNRWQALLYELMRDGCVSPGELHERVEALARSTEVVAFSNDFLAGYSVMLNARLHGQTGEQALALGHDAIRHALAGE